MKKTKFIALALAVALMVMGAGYAYWTDSVTLTNKITTGNFDMQITDATTRTGDNQSQNEDHDWHQYDWTHKVSVDDSDPNIAIVEFDDMYPGGQVDVTLNTKNMSTIPAKLKSIDVELIDGNEEVFNLLKAQSSWKADIKGDGEKDAWKHVEQFKHWRNLENALENKFIQSVEGLVIEPNGYLNTRVALKLDPSAGNDLQNKTLKFKVTFNWEQWSTNPQSNPYDGDNGYGGDGDLQ